MNRAGAVIPATVAVAVNVPAVSPAANGGEVAMPESFVGSVTWGAPPSNVPPVPRENATLAPCTGSPFASRTFARSGFGKRAPTVADWLAGESGLIVAGTPLGVLTTEKTTDPSAEVATTR